MPTETDLLWDFHKNLNEVGGYIPEKLRHKRRKNLGSPPLSVERYSPQEPICLIAAAFPLGCLEEATQKRH